MTIKEMGVLASLKELVLRVEMYLKYKMYHAENIYPYPEDQNVAEWVREEAEPNGWVHFSQDSTHEEMKKSTEIQASMPAADNTKKKVIKSRTI